MSRPGLVLVLAAAVFLGWAGWTYWQKGEDPSLERDLALATGQRQVAELNTLDHANPDAGLRVWLAATTGPLHDQLKRDSAATARQARASRVSARGSVLAAALTGFDPRAGTAQLIASVTVQLTPAQGAASLQRKRFTAALSRTGDGWRLTTLTALPVGAR